MLPPPNGTKAICREVQSLTAPTFAWNGAQLDVADDWYDSLSDLALAQGNIYVGDGSSHPVATSSIYISNNQNVGIGTTSPLSKLSVNGNLFLEGASRYINFGATTSVGTDGYGIRDSGGTIQVKSANGTWASIGAGAMSLNDLNDVTIVANDGDMLVYDAGSSQWVDRATSTLNINLVNTTGILPVNRGGTGSTTWTQYAIPYLTDSNTFGQIAIGTSTYLLAVNAGGNGYTWVNASSTGTVLSQEQVEDYVGNMVDGNTETLITVTYESGDGTLDFVVDNNLANYNNALSAFWSTSTGALPVAYGGTGTTTFNQYSLLYAPSANTIGQIIAGTEGQTLKIVAGIPTWSATSSGAAHSLLSTDHIDAIAQAAVSGGLIFASTSNQWDQLSIGGNGSVLMVTGNLPAWSATSSLGFDNYQSWTAAGNTGSPGAITSGATFTVSGSSGLTAAIAGATITISPDGTHLIPLISSTTNWNWAYNTVTASSTYWDQGYLWANAGHTNWDTAYSIVNASSTLWQSAYLTVTASGTNWNWAYNTVNASSTKWDEGYLQRGSVIDGAHLAWNGAQLDVADDWYDSLSDLALAQGNIYAGDGFSHPGCHFLHIYFK